MNILSIFRSMKNLQQTPAVNRNSSIVRAVAYPRYSEGEDQRSESITAQMRAIEAYCKERGYVLTAIYPDESRSATTDNRENFQKMMDDASKGLFDVVIVHKLDRFARDKFDSVFYKRYLKMLGIRVESVLERLDGSPESIIMESILEAYAEYYSANLAREVRKGQIENALVGKHAGGRPSYGLKVNRETLMYEIDEEKAPAVRIYFEGIDSDKSIEWIAERLNSLGYRTQTGRKFTRNSFDGWATNRRYIGEYTWDAQAPKDALGRRNAHRKKPLDEWTIIPNAFPAIISRDLFDRVGAKIQMRKHKPGRMRAKINYLLTGKIFCGCPECNSIYEGNSYVHREKRYAYYKCKSKCGNVSLRKDDFEDLVIRKITDSVFSDDAMQVLAQKTRQLFLLQKQERKDDAAPIRREIADLDVKISNWLDLVGSGIRSVVDKIKEAEQKKAMLEVELLKVESMSATNDISEAQIVQFLQNQKSILFSDNEDDRKAIIQEFIDKIIIVPDDGDRKGKSFKVTIDVRGFEGAPSGAPKLKQKAS